jgi:hypothetical protein
MWCIYSEPITDIDPQLAAHRERGQEVRLTTRPVVQER